LRDGAISAQETKEANGSGHPGRMRTSTMYIDTLMSRFARSPVRRAAPLAACAALAAVLLAGCNLFGSDSSAPVIPKPATLAPQADAFSQRNTRIYSWLEELVRPGKADSILSLETASIRFVDSVIGGVSRPFFDVRTSFTRENPAPAGFFARLGFALGADNYDTARVPDPGPSLPFPVAPAAGWRLDTVVDGLRYVRVLTGTATVEAAGLRYETWAFAESTWWNEPVPVLVASGSAWFGRDGLVKSVTNRTNFSLNGAAAATVRRTLQPN